MENKVIGIEGYVGAGKTSICRKLINLIPNSIILEGGNLYRAIVYSLMTSGINEYEPCRYKICNGKAKYRNKN